MPLSGKEVREAKPGTYQDSADLYLVVTDKGKKRWFFRYSFANEDREIELHEGMSLAKARVSANHWKNILEKKMDPQEFINNEKILAQKNEKELRKSCLGVFAIIAPVAFAIFWLFDPIQYISDKASEFFPSTSSRQRYPANWSAEQRLRYDNMPSWEKSEVDRQIREGEAICSASSDC